jgi:hypothetical protein
MRIEACGCGYVAFDKTLRVTQSTGYSSRLSSRGLRIEVCGNGIVSFDTTLRVTQSTV